MGSFDTGLCLEAVAAKRGNCAFRAARRISLRRMPADTSLLAQVALFERLNDEERELLAAQVDAVEFDAGQSIFKRGDPGDALYIVGDGEVEIFVQDTTGQRIVFETAKRGDFFGELSLLDAEPRSASAVAIAPTKALRLDRNDLTLLFTRHPTSALDVLAVISRRLREADKLLGSRVTESPNQAVEERMTPLLRVADYAADFSGSFKFLLVHVLWFGVWIALNGEIIHGVHPFDPFPFGLLTMIVSLEAIFLSCMVLISQNRSAAKEKIRSDAEYDANIRAGLEVTQLHVKVDALYEQALARLERLEKAAGTSPAAKPAGAPATLPPRSSSSSTPGA
jgi:CRP/FNR family transcriptional regulator, cyclic AMP receptor protein